MIAFVVGTIMIVIFVWGIKKAIEIHFHENLNRRIGRE